MVEALRRTKAALDLNLHTTVEARLSRLELVGRRSKPKVRCWGLLSTGAAAAQRLG